MFRRTEESKLTSWFFEIDRKLLYGVLILIVLGIYFAVSAGSVAADRINEPWYFFFLKGLPFYAVGILGLFVASWLNKKTIIRLSAIDVIFGLLLLVVTLVAPHTIKGSNRFVSMFGLNILPSDIMKPGFVIMTAWFVSKMKDKFGDKLFSSWRALFSKDLSWWWYLAVLGPALIIIFKHPDVGTAALYLAVLAMILLVAGLPLLAFFGMIGFGIMGLVVAYFTMPHVHNRFAAMFTGDGDKFQVTQSVQSIQHGGLFGTGNDAFIKQSLPDAHTDFIYAAIAEDFGAILACVLLGLIFYIFKRLISDALNARDKFVFYAVTGTATLFITQTCINLVSTLRLFPPKGMTLPFISYGGSSLLAFCALFGMIIALIREDKWR